MVQRITAKYNAHQVTSEAVTEVFSSAVFSVAAKNFGQLIANRENENLSKTRCVTHSRRHIHGSAAINSPPQLRGLYNSRELLASQ